MNEFYYSHILSEKTLLHDIRADHKLCPPFTQHKSELNLNCKTECIIGNWHLYLITSVLSKFV